jgi:hypothetical protein
LAARERTRQHQINGARNLLEEGTGKEGRMLVLRPWRPVDKMDLTNIAFWLHKDYSPTTRPLKPGWATAVNAPEKTTVFRRRFFG